MLQDAYWLILALLLGLGRLLYVRLLGDGAPETRK